ncbi:MAG: PQQ-binding-like beta-propeller repeat protein [Gammaproteobacteria bacterium]
MIALDPETGKERWRHDPRIDRTRRYAEAAARGVSVWEDLTPASKVPCLRRIFTGTLDARLIALDATTGQPCADFGTNGVVDLTQGIRIRDRGDYTITSPPAVLNNVVIVGSAVGDNRATDVERGVIRAFDAITGAQKWAFDPLPDSPTHPAAAAWNLSQALATGAGNSWAPMSVDPDKGVVFVPTGSASPDFYGGKRVGDNRFANSLLALDANTGQIRWYQQLVHHDLWDYDLASQPALIEMERRGTPISAVIQATKNGMLFLFDRDTGKPALDDPPSRWFPRAIRPAKRLRRRSRSRRFPRWSSTVRSASTTRGASRSGIAASAGISSAIIATKAFSTPPDSRGTIMRPSNLGGMNWGGIAYDARSQRVLAVVNHLRCSSRCSHLPKWKSSARPGTTRGLSSLISEARPTPCGVRRCFRRGASRARRRPGAPW